MKKNTWRENIKPLTIPKKLEYIWDYYKLLLAGIAGGIFLVCLAVQLLFGQKMVTELSVAMINASADSDAAFRVQDEFAEYAHLDGESQEVLFDNGYQMKPQSMDQMTMASQTKLMAAVRGSSVDVLLMSEDVFAFYLKNELFADLGEVLSEGEAARLTDKLVPGAGEEDEKAYGLDVGGSRKLTGLYSQSPVILAVPANAVNKDNIQKFIRYLLS